MAIKLINKTDIYEYYGLSTDTKPSICPNASIFFEMDTSKAYMWDEQNQTWRELGG